ncbi:MAG: hypothetical protein RIT27_1351 [Pseudomonadota bacterium]|jgi:hypothetical protein
MKDLRFILYHKQSTSGRTRFFRFAHGGVCGFVGLPTLSQVVDVHQEKTLSSIITHPAALLSDIQQRLGLLATDLRIDGEYHEYVDAQNMMINIYLAHFTAIDPPFEMAEKQGGRFVELAQSRDLSRPELELLRRAYQLILG